MACPLRLVRRAAVGLARLAKNARSRRCGQGRSNPSAGSFAIAYSATMIGFHSVSHYLGQGEWLVPYDLLAADRSRAQTDIQRSKRDCAARCHCRCWFGFIAAACPAR